MGHSGRRDSRLRFSGIAATAVLSLLLSLLAAVPAQATVATGTGGLYIPATGRLLDTDTGEGGYSTPMPAGGWRTVQVAGRFGIPDDGSVGAVSLVASFQNMTTEGELRGRPDADTPSTMLGKYGGVDNRMTTFGGVLAVADDGTIQVQAQTETRLILHVQGYYTSIEDGVAAGGFVPMNGTRIVDTRSGLGAPKAQLSSGSSIDIQVTGIASGIPSTASGVIVNMIAVNTSTERGWLTSYPTGTTRPVTVFHYPPQLNTSMQAQLELSDSGHITIYNNLTATNLVVEVQGYFTAEDSEGVSAFTPAAGRAYDSRVTGGSYAPNETRSIPIAGVDGVPAVGSGISAVVMTLTSLGTTTGTGGATVWADGTPKPGTISINLGAGTLRSNTITVPLGANGAVSLKHVGDGNANYIIDIQGWYADPVAPTIDCDLATPLGTWANSLPTSPVSCTVTAPPGLSTDATLFTVIDGVPATESALSSTGSTTQIATVPASAGWHTIDALVMQSDGTTTAQTVAFGFNDGAPSDALAAIQRVRPEAFMNVTTATPDLSATYAIETVGAQAASIPSSPSDPVLNSASDPATGEEVNLSVELPFADEAANGEAEADGIISYDNGNGSFTVPISYNDGSVAIHTVLTGPSSPQAFPYPVSVPAGGALSITEAGSVAMTDDSGAVVGVLETPWAKDAAGNDVPTRFVLNGNTVTQEVDLSNPDIQYPVVADPDMWAVIRAAAGCALEIAGLALAGAKVLQVFLKAEKIIKSLSRAIKFYNQLGGKMDKVITLLKKYVKNRASLTKKQVDALEGLIRAGSMTLLNAIGLGSCWSLITRDY